MSPFVAPDEAPAGCAVMMISLGVTILAAVAFIVFQVVSLIMRLQSVLDLLMWIAIILAVGLTLGMIFGKAMKGFPTPSQNVEKEFQEILDRDINN